MHKKTDIGTYSDFGLRDKWLSSFLAEGPEWLDNNDLGPVQIHALRKWLIKADLFDPNRKTLTDMGKDISLIYKVNKFLAWDLIYVNLYYNSDVFCYFCEFIEFDMWITPERLLKLLNNQYPDYSPNTISKAVNALLNTFESSPLGNGNLVVVKKEKGKRIIKRKKREDINLLILAYSLYKLGEKNGIDEIYVDDIYTKKLSGSSYKLFGISKKILKTRLKELNWNGILNVDHMDNPKKILLNENLSSSKILKMLSNSKKIVKYNYSISKREEFEMNYSEIIKLYDYFHPVFDLEKETGDYWKQFIPNERFYNVLSTTLNAFTSSEPKNRASLWLQGTYGTGKSHATGVIKHLLYDDLDKISDFLEKFENEQVKFKLINFRKNKKVFPVILKGTNYVFDNRTFALAIQQGVKSALKRYDFETIIKSDLEILLDKFKSNELNLNVIFKNTELGVYGNFENIIEKLEQGDISIFKSVESILSQKGIHLSTEKISDWLVDVQMELRKKNISDYLMIYWDEFTGLFELEKSGMILTEIQSIAELSKDYGIYLFIVSHRTPYQTNISKQDIQKILGRFNDVLNYSMEPITTYHIIDAAIQKKNREKWKEIRDLHMENLTDIIKEIAGSEGTIVKNSLKNLFPIHPYTAYVMTFIARNIGSTQRSIFNFLYDSEKGFKKFIKENPGTNGEKFISIDYLWDYFYGIFENTENERVLSIIEKYKLHKETLKDKGKNFLKVFKGILLLNILQRFVELEETSFITPSLVNIYKSFKGIIDSHELKEILEFIARNQIISITPDELFLVTATTRYKDIAKEKESLKVEYKEIEEILGNSKEFLIENLRENLSREMEVLIVDGNLTEHLLKRRIDNGFKKNYSVKVVLAICKNKVEYMQITKVIKEITEQFKNIIFVILESYFSEDVYDKFLEYKAFARCAMKYNNNNERQQYENYAVKTVEKWVQNVIDTSFVDIFIDNENYRLLFSKIGENIQKRFIKNIFTYGFETLEHTTKNANIWTRKKAKAAAEIFLTAKDRSQLEEKTSKGIEKYLRSILVDSTNEYIVNYDLTFKDGFDEHPLKKMYLDIKAALEGKDYSFFLGETLEFLTKPPYGVYSNMIYFAAMGFLMREYVGKFYEVGTGVQINESEMKDKILHLFTYWEQKSNRNAEKLHVRIGTEEEKDLIEMLKIVFNFSEYENIRSLNDIKWEIRNWEKERGFPLWIYKYTPHGKKNTVCNAIDSICNFTSKIDEDYNNKEIKILLENISRAMIDLQILLEKNPEEFFINWIKSIKNVEIKDDEIEKIIEYLRRNLQEEISFWNEDKVREKIKDWYLRKVSHVQRTNKYIEKISDETYKGLEKNEKIKVFYEASEKEVIEKIKNINDIKILKKIILELIESNPEIATIIIFKLEELL